MRLAAALLLCAACGGGGGSTEAPIRLTSGGLSSSAITIPSGGRVHFFNMDTANHQIASSSCPGLATPLLTPGSDSLRPQMTGPLDCSFSDALTSAPIFNGSVTVAAPGTVVGDPGY